LTEVLLGLDHLLPTIGKPGSVSHRAIPYIGKESGRLDGMSTGVVGRPGELAVIERFLDRLAEGWAILLLEGEPGIGKTTLLRAGVEAAQRRDLRVLRCAASPSEARLSYAALTDLFGGVEEEVLACLPQPQRAALDAALLRSAPVGGQVNRRAVASAALSVLEVLAAGCGVVVAVDDLHWVDRPSARVLEFCCRRMMRGLGLIAAQRLDVDPPWPVTLLRAREPGWIEECRVPPLPSNALARLLGERVEQPIGRRALLRVQQASGGNPFYALELAWALGPTVCRHRLCRCLRAWRRSSLPAWPAWGRT
jgi:predicted ATPase